MADNFLTSPKAVGVLEKVRPNGDILRYDPVTNSFGVISSNGAIRTYYKPTPRSSQNPVGYDPLKYSTGLEYYNAQ